MLVPPKTLVALGATVLTVRQRLASRRPGGAGREQERARRRLLASLSPTAFGRHYGLTPGLSLAEWQQRVAPRRYEQFVPFIERMQRGESDVLWPGPCRLFATTAGTSGTTKRLPVTTALLDHFHRAAFQSLLHYQGRMPGSGIFRGRHLVLNHEGNTGPSDSLSGDAHVSRLMARALPAWVEKHYYEGASATSESAVDSGRKSLVETTRQRDIRAVAGMPPQLLRFAEAGQETNGAGKQGTATFQQLWPQLECLVHGGLPVGPYAEQLRQAAGPRVTFHEVLAATEAFIATQEAESAAGLRLLTDTGVFFEFIPLAEFDAARLETLGPKAVAVSAVKPNVDYVILVTTPGGLCRYVLGDIVRFLTVDPPRLIFVGRTGLQLNAFGESLQEREVTDALTAVCQRHSWRIVNFHVAPYPISAPGRPTRGCHEWWIELKPGTAETPTGPVIVQELDRELRRTCARYEARRAHGVLDAPVARLVMPGVFDQWMHQSGRGGNQHKVPRCRSDRVVAEELSRLAPYAAH